MQSDSSEDEYLNKIREATDTQFMKDSLYKQSENEECIVESNQLKSVPSLRKVEGEEKQFRTFNVTPEFQNYVAKALSKKLEEYLKKNMKDYSFDNCRKKRVKDCVKLLKSSKYPIDMKKAKVDSINSTNNVTLLKKNIHKTAENVNDVIEEDDLKSIVISGEDILGLEGIKYWSNRSKAEVFKYTRDKNGLLQQIPPEYKTLPG